MAALRYGKFVAVPFAAAFGAGVYQVAAADGDPLHPAHHHITSTDYFTSYDHGSVRRGFEVFTKVCHSCHGVENLSFRELIGVTHSEDEVKALAATFQINDIDEIGSPIKRPGRITDKLPNPYANEEQARSRNNGAYPPDLSVITKARHNGPLYVFQLLISYKEDPPTGLELRDGMHYNPYFQGHAIAMTPPLYDGVLEYDDGTPATLSQTAKDVVEFLSWMGEPETEERKLTAAKFFALVAPMTLIAGYTKLFVWAPIKTKKIVGPAGFKK